MENKGDRKFCKKRRLDTVKEIHVYCTSENFSESYLSCMIVPEQLVNAVYMWTENG